LGLKTNFATYSFGSFADSIDQQPNGNLPPIYQDDIQESSQESVEFFLQSLIAMISRVMVPGPVSEDNMDDLDRHVKLFLSFVHQFECNRKPSAQRASVPGGKDIIVWLQKFNFITLLRLAEDIKLFDSLRLLWEGDGKGEGVLPLLKPLIRSLTGNWALHAARKFYEARALDRVGMSTLFGLENSHPDLAKNGAIAELLDSARTLFGEREDTLGGDLQDQDDNDDSTSSTHYKDVYMYQSYEGFADSFHSGDPVSCVAYPHIEGDQLQFFIMLKGEQGIVKLLPGEYECTKNGAAFFAWSIAASTSDAPFEFAPKGWKMRREQLNQHTKYFILLLPITLNDGRFVYYLITHTWEEMIANGGIVRPRVSCATY
jgi:hypothetical protein